jgi:hypothetical protein
MPDHLLSLKPLFETQVNVYFKYFVKPRNEKMVVENNCRFIPTPLETEILINITQSI